MAEKTLTFRDLLKQKVWTDYGDYVSEATELYANDVREHVLEEKRLIQDIRNHPSFKKLAIRNVKDNMEKATELLNQGLVVGVDGTVSKYRLFSGMRCQIGVVAVNYIGEKIRHSFFVSEANVKEQPEDALERLAGRASFDEGLSEMAIRGLMLFREREAGLNEQFNHCQVMFHGPLLPFELMSGLGKLRALEPTLDLLRTIVRSKRFFSVISSTSYQDYLTFGRAIQRGEYLTASEYTLGQHIRNSEGFLSKGKWRGDELETVEEFLGDYADKIMIGVLRVSERPYVFHAHKDNFDLAASIIARDAMFQKEKGFPLLIDYADSLCSQYFSSSEFKRLVEWELAKQGAYLSEAPERDLRMK